MVEDLEAFLFFRLLVVFVVAFDSLSAFEYNFSSTITCRAATAASTCICGVPRFFRRFNQAVTAISMISRGATLVVKLFLLQYISPFQKSTAAVTIQNIFCCGLGLCFIFCLSITVYRASNADSFCASPRRTI